MGKKADFIEHKGIVERIGANGLQVRIVQASACSSCSARQLCRAGESREKVIEVDGHYPTLRVGSEVTLRGTVRQGLRASMLAYVVPLCLMLIVLFATARRWGEGIAAAAALLSVALYYGVLYMMRRSLRGQFTFQIVRQD